jgi:hypothetical protein
MVRIPTLMSRRFTLLAAVLLISPAFMAVGELSPGLAAAPIGTSTKRQTRAFATPLRRHGIATEPPSGARPTEAIRFNTSLQWKANPSTRTVFAIDADRRVWFIDPTSGWPYTLDAQGMAYTANALSGIVYSLGKLALWQGSVPYFFQNWAFVGGVYALTTFDLYLSIYTNPAIELFAYGDTYAEIWQYQNYFDSSAFSSQGMSLETGEDPGGRHQDTNVYPNAGADGQTNGNSNGSQGIQGGTDAGISPERILGPDFGDGADFGAGGDFGGGE